MPEEAELVVVETGAPYRARFRPGTVADRRRLVRSWVPVLERGPEAWLDREWAWAAFGEADLHVDASSEWLVLADEVEPEASGELFGVLVTAGPITAEKAGVGELLPIETRLLWVEYVAVAPSLRRDCPVPDQRNPSVKGVGVHLMRAAIARSLDLRLGGLIGLHAEGPSADVYRRWKMRRIGDADHRAGGAFPVFFGDAIWAAEFLGGEAKQGGHR